MPRSENILTFRMENGIELTLNLDHVDYVQCDPKIPSVVSVLGRYLDGVSYADARLIAEAIQRRAGMDGRP